MMQKFAWLQIWSCSAWAARMRDTCAAGGSDAATQCQQESWAGMSGMRGSRLGRTARLPAHRLLLHHETDNGGHHVACVAQRGAAHKHLSGLRSGGQGQDASRGVQGWGAPRR